MSAQNLFRHLTATIFLLAFVAVDAAAQDRQPNQTNQLHMKAKPAVVRILTGYTGQWVWRNRQWQTNYISSGSGFIINPNGYVVTNAHVVNDIKQGDDHGKQVLLNILAQQALESVGQPVNQYTLANAAQILGQQLARDLGSTNGTFLNHNLNQRITETELKDGDVLTLGGQGSAEFTVRF